MQATRVVDSNPDANGTPDRVPTFESPSVLTTWDDYIAQFETYMFNHDVKREDWAKLLYTRLRGKAAKSSNRAGP